VIEAETQAMLNSITEHDFQDAFKEWQSAGNGAHAQKETTSRVVVASRPKVNFLKVCSTSPDFKSDGGQ
jgi:hypothetical protein